jgi:hypothetical protein
VFSVATPQMMDAAPALGHDRPLFMDATHGTVKYTSSSLVCSWTR